MWKMEDFMTLTELAQNRNLWLTIFLAQSTAELQRKRKNKTKASK